MKLTEKEINKLQEAYSALNDLQRLLTERIEENNVRGKPQGMLVEQFNHCFMFYREKIWTAQFAINDVLEKKTKE